MRLFPAGFLIERLMKHMLSDRIKQAYLNILKSGLVSALGCTEPTAIAYAAAKAREVLGAEPDMVEAFCSGNIIKNVKGVTVPNSGGMHGIEAAAVLGVLAGRADLELEALSTVTEDDRMRARELIAQGYCVCRLQEGEENLYIRIVVYRGDERASVTVQQSHSHITEIARNGTILFSADAESESGTSRELDLLNVKDILTFADTVPFDKLKPILEPQITLNTRIAEEGLSHPYGAQVGRTLLEIHGDDVTTRAKARAAAGSDARMGGCPLPVVINSGSGNQGITVSLPVVEFAKELEVPEERLYRALAISNLVAIHQKKYIGSLSAYCGAVSAACGSGAGITYLYGGGYDRISATITNTIANVGGIVCDGAKASCAAKIASAMDAAITAHFMSMGSHCFRPGEGLVKKDVEGTIRSLGYIGRVGMKETDTQILKLMLSDTSAV